MLKQYLHVYCNYQQKNWSKLLSLVEFAYNNALSATTSVFPFFANKEYHPNIIVHPKHDIAFFWAHNFAIDLDELQSTLKAEISTAWQHYQKSTDAQCFPTPDFEVGDKVFVKAQFFQTTQPLKKLSKKYLGSYEIIAQPGILLFTLHLPDSMHSVHPVFHMSILEPAVSNTFSKRIQPAPTPVIIEGKPKYEISQIVNSKIDHQQAYKLLYRVIWLGYEDTRNESEWISAFKLIYAADLVSNFHITHPTKSGPLPLSWSHCCTCPLSLHIFQQGFFFINSLVHSVCLFSLTSSFSTLSRVFFQKFQTFFNFIFLIFLLTHLNHRKWKILLTRPLF